MTDFTGRLPQRDAAESVFSHLLARMESFCDGFKAIVFYDEEGETIDYHSYMDPFQTRLTAAHYGIIESCAREQSKWIGMGEVRSIEAIGPTTETITVTVADGFFATLVLEAGNLDEKVREELISLAALLRDEAGL